MDMTTRMTDYSTEQVTSQGDTLMMAQSSSAKSYDSSMKLDASGITISGPAEDFRLQMEMPMMPGLPLGGNIASMSATMQAPLLADDSFGPVAFNLDLNGLTLDDMVWAMGDPMGALPRDPIHLTIDLTGTLKHNVEWLDFANLEANLEALGDMLPVEPGQRDAERAAPVGRWGPRSPAKVPLPLTPQTSRLSTACRVPKAS